AYVPSAGFDAFAANDVLASFTVDATATVWTRRRFSLAAGLGWDMAQRGDGLRGLSTSLTAHRFSVPIELRYHAAPSLYFFGRVAPGALLALASVEDPSAPAPLADARWMFATDL